ncbi:unnamed protein product [Symbiodinium natans]|uniref:Bifunctional lysine-specific demethylase and histidyl-hydroxylase n=1 Tax=Symbiodinium natans TaxID=878477 RepID=A0A812NJT6_9DINO|nr:unnamed protein product [Symbiodinium natans]
MSAGRTWFGVGGALALLLGAFFQSPQWLYRSDFASVDYDYVRNESQCPDISVGDVELPCLPLPPTALGDFERTGFLVLRQAIPLVVVKRLFQEVQCTLQPQQPSDLDQWALSARNVWMDSEAFSSFVLHERNPLGCLAAQLIHGASTVRYGNEAVNMIRPGQTGARTWHFDVQSNLRLEQSPRGLPLVRFFLPLGPQDLTANWTGGSLQLLPLEAVRRLRRSYKSCFVDRERKLTVGAECAVAAEAVAETPDLSLGDIVLYSPLIPHKTQAVKKGTRVGYLGSLYDPELLTRWVRKEPIPSQADPERYRLADSMLFDVFCLAGAACYDQSSRACHHNLNWQSAATQGISDGTTPCFPQIYPEHDDDEVAARVAKSLGYTLASTWQQSILQALAFIRSVLTNWSTRWNSHLGWSDTRGTDASEKEAQKKTEEQLATITNQLAAVARVAPALQFWLDPCLGFTTSTLRTNAGNSDSTATEGKLSDPMLPALRIIKDRWDSLKHFSLYALYLECEQKQLDFGSSDDEHLAYLVRASNAQIDQILQIDKDRIISHDSMVPGLCYDLLRENAELRKMTNSYQLHVLMLYQGKNISDASIGTCALHAPVMMLDRLERSSCEVGGSGMSTEVDDTGSELRQEQLMFGFNGFGGEDCVPCQVCMVMPSEVSHRV